MSKTLVVGDPHLQIQRLEDNQLFLDRIGELAQEHDRILILGDLFHTFAVIRSEILSQWNSFFTQIKTPVLCLIGNHDYASQNGGSHALEVFRDLITVIDESRCIDGVYYLPFIRDIQKFESACKEIPADSVLICHQSFIGVQFSSGFEDPHGADPKAVSHLKAVISGHIHSEQTVANVWYPGTPYQNNFGEAGEKKRVFTIGLTQAGYQILMEHDLKLPGFFQITAERVDQIVLPEPDPMMSYKIVAKGTPTEIAAFWADPKTKTFREKSRKLVDALVPERSSIALPGAQENTQKEKLNAYIKAGKWRTPTERLIESANELLFASKEYGNH